MAQMTLKINGYAHTLACADGEEAHLQAMVEQVEQRVAQIKVLGTQSGESRLLLQAALLMADELHDLKVETAALRRAKPASTEDVARYQQLIMLASRAEEIAAELERH